MKLQIVAVLLLLTSLQSHSDPNSDTKSPLTVKGAFFHDAAGKGCSSGVGVNGIDMKTNQTTEICAIPSSLKTVEYIAGATEDAISDGQTYVISGFSVGSGEVFEVHQIAGNEQTCSSDAKQALHKKYGFRFSDISYVYGSLVGDAADAVEIDMYQVAGKPGLYKVELDGEMCDLRTIEIVNN
jgi:hypothetical protein